MNKFIFGELYNILCKKSKMQLPFTIDELIEKPWNKFIVYTLSNDEKKQLINHEGLTKQPYNFPKGNVWSEHQHEKPQLLLVIKGELTHKADGKEYHQLQNDLLIVPANKLHKAYSGKNTDLIVYAFNKI